MHMSRMCDTPVHDGLPGDNTTIRYTWALTNINRLAMTARVYLCICTEYAPYPIRVLRSQYFEFGALGVYDRVASAFDKQGNAQLRDFRVEMYAFSRSVVLRMRAIAL